MLEMPTPVKVLKYLKEGGEELSAEELAARLDEPLDDVRRALRELERRSLVENVRGSYRYKKDSFSEEVARKVLRVYDRVVKEPSLELLLAGLLSTFSPLRPSTVIKALEEAGGRRQEVEALIEEEIRKGNLRRVKAICVGQVYSGSKYIPVGFYIIEEETSESEKRELIERLREYYSWVGLEGVAYEEDMLIGEYPPELAKAGRSYLNEWKELKERVRREAPHVFRWLPIKRQEVVCYRTDDDMGEGGWAGL